MRRRVVITGMGAITPVGQTVREFWQAQLAGRSGMGPIAAFDASRFPTTFAAEVKHFDLACHLPDPARWAHAGPTSQFAAAAAQQALADAGLLDEAAVDRTRIGVYLGCGEGNQDFPTFAAMLARAYDPQRRAVDSAAFVRDGLRELDPRRVPEHELHSPAAHLSAHFDLQGLCCSCLTACAAGSQAIGEAAELIRQGDADLMLAGGAHTMIQPLGVSGFVLLTAFSTRNAEPQRASRPFDLGRDGFVLGEGAGLVVLEELEHARRRGALIHAELTGYGSTADAFRVTDSHPDGRGAAACMRKALADAGLAPADVGYINAHGTSTPSNDRVETLAIKKVFGEQAYRVPVSSTKSTIGHLLAAAGAVELIVSVMVLREGLLPPTMNYETPDPDCDLDYVPNVARQRRVGHVLSNSFAFGGQNVALVVSRFAD